MSNHLLEEAKLAAERSLKMNGVNFWSKLAAESPLKMILINTSLILNYQTYSKSIEDIYFYWRNHSWLLKSAEDEQTHTGGTTAGC